MGEALTMVQLEDAMVQAVNRCLSLSGDEGRVRLSWPTDTETGDMPGWSRDENICFLRIGHFDDPFTRLSEVTHGNGPEGDFWESRRYVRGHEMLCIFYGKDAMEDAEALRTGMTSESLREFLWETYGIAPLAQTAPAVRADEWFGGAWWRRYDVVIRFYEGVAKTAQALPIAVSPDIRILNG